MELDDIFQKSSPENILNIIAQKVSADITGISNIPTKKIDEILTKLEKGPYNDSKDFYKGIAVSKEIIQAVRDFKSAMRMINIKYPDCVRQYVLNVKEGTLTKSEPGDPIT